MSETIDEKLEELRRRCEAIMAGDLETRVLARLEAKNNDPAYLREKLEICEGEFDAIREQKHIALKERNMLVAVLSKLFPAHKDKRAAEGERLRRHFRSCVDCSECLAECDPEMARAVKGGDDE